MLRCAVDIGGRRPEEADGGVPGAELLLSYWVAYGSGLETVRSLATDAYPVCGWPSVSARGWTGGALVLSSIDVSAGSTLCDRDACADCCGATLREPAILLGAGVVYTIDHDI
jgi:hypothetical protein